MTKKTLSYLVLWTEVMWLNTQIAKDTVEYQNITCEGVCLIHFPLFLSSPVGFCEHFGPHQNTHLPPKLR